MDPTIHIIVGIRKMETEQRQFQSGKTAGHLETCDECGRSFTRTQFLDHLFRDKDCMRKYWEEEEKTHVFRLRHHRGSKNVPSEI